MNYPNYKEYQDSGVTWLGLVPKSWELRRLGTLFIERREKVSDKEFEPLSVTRNGVVPQLDTAAKSDDGDNRKKVCVGDFVINSRSDRKGSSGLARQNGSVSLINTVLQPIGILREYVHYLLRSELFQEEYFRYGKGIVADLWTTHFSEMKNITMVVPPLEEQTSIAAFLDRETCKIDLLIVEQERLIELLKEKRQTIISHAVTKGLNPDAFMKPSDIEWLGSVPEHWKLLRLRFVLELNPSKTEINQVDKDTLVSFLPMDSINVDGSLCLNQERKIQEVETGYTFFRNGDVTIAKITPCFENGKGAVMRNLTNGIGFGTTELIVIRPMIGVIQAQYLRWLFISTPFMTLGKAYMYGAGGQKRVPDEFILNFQIGIPSIPEQNTISKYLDSETRKIDALVNEAQNAIVLLHERRKALISAAVTGKIDVRKLKEKELE